MQTLNTDAVGGRYISQIALSDVRRLRLSKKYIRLGTSVGTITCYACAWSVSDYARTWIISGHFTLDCIEDPEEVLRLIENARAQL